MPHDRLANSLAKQVRELDASGIRKGHERVISGLLPPANGKGPRYLLAGHDDKPFLRMNANSYLGFSFDAEIIAAEEEAVRKYGAGPGAVRFISGTWAPHVELEQSLAAFHGREAAIIFNSAYSAVMGLLPTLTTPETAIISDELNHNCIINAIRLGAPKEKRIYRHLNMSELEEHLEATSRSCERAIIVTDGVFSMRGDHAPLDEILALARSYDSRFAENVLVVVDDSHGVGAYGKTGRGTEEVTDSGAVDVLIGTLGKAFGVNGGYAVASESIVDYLRETSPYYIYSNPITPGEAAAAVKAVDILNGARGRKLLAHCANMTMRFERGLTNLGLEIVPSEHPITPLMIRDTSRTMYVVSQLFERGVLATAITYPVVPRGDEEIRFQICAGHTPDDIDEALGAIRDAWNHSGNC